MLKPVGTGAEHMVSASRKLMPCAVTSHNTVGMLNSNTTVQNVVMMITKADLSAHKTKSVQTHAKAELMPIQSASALCCAKGAEKSRTLSKRSKLIHTTTLDGGEGLWLF